MITSCAGFRRNLYTRQGNEEALKLFLKVIDLDLNYAAAYGMAAYCRHRRRAWGWTDDRRGGLHELAHLARQAAKLGKDDSVALFTAGWVIAYDLRDPELGAALIDRALALNPSEATAWWMRAFAHVWLGEPEPGHRARATRHAPQSTRSVDPPDIQRHRQRVFRVREVRGRRRRRWLRCRFNPIFSLACAWERQLADSSGGLRKRTG